MSYDAESWTDEPRIERQWGVNSGDPAECCDPWFITNDQVTAYATAQVIREPHILQRTVTTIYGPWEPVPHVVDEEPPF